VENEQQGEMMGKERLLYKHRISALYYFCLRVSTFLSLPSAPL